MGAINSEDSFVNVWFGDEHAEGQHKETFADQWMDQSSARHSSPSTTAYNALRKLYPDHSIVMTSHYLLNGALLSFPGAIAVPLEKTPLMVNELFASLPRRNGGGALAEEVEFGAFRISWDIYDFLSFHIKYAQGFGVYNVTYVLHAGPQEPSRRLLIAAGVWQNELHNEIWVFNQGFWSKDHALWLDVQKGDWKDVILKDQFKTALKKDIYGFFDSEDVYKRLGIPWKRGLIMYGPPGNGKTISLKVVIKTCSDKGFSPLYVKSFQSEEGAMQDVFNKARELSPCVLIMEDLDSLINERNRSFFLNQLDGLVGNDGLLVIGTTNHFEKLDPALSGRPSRFDRKYLFDDPDRDERVLYAQYWQKKLKDNNDVAYPDSLVYDIADRTDGFSFAYLKEAFVSSLVILAGEKDKPSFETVVMEQIKILHDALDKLPKDSVPFASATLPVQPPASAQEEAAHPAGRLDSKSNQDSLLSAMQRKFAGLSPYSYLAEQAQHVGVPGISSRPLPATPSEFWISQPPQHVGKHDLVASRPQRNCHHPARELTASAVVPSTKPRKIVVQLPPSTKTVSSPAPASGSGAGSTNSAVAASSVSTASADTKSEPTKTSFSWYSPEMHRRG